MGLFAALDQAAGNKRNGVLIAACLSGLSQTLLLVLFNEAAAAPQQAGVQRFVLFLLGLLLYVLCTRRTYDLGVEIVEALAHGLRRRIVARIEQVELEDLEALGTAEIFEQLTGSTAAIANAADDVAYFLQTAFTLVFATLYLLWLSPAALGIVAFLFGVALGLYRLRLVAIRGRIQKLARLRSSFVARLSDLLTGFKEVLLNRRRAQDLHQDLWMASDAVRQQAQGTAAHFFDNQLHAYVAGFAVLAAIGFVIPRHVDLSRSTLAQLVCCALYFRGVANGVAVGFPAYVHSQHALTAILDLEKRLVAAASSSSLSDEDSWHGRLVRLSARDLAYQYRGDAEDGGFRVGPISLEVAAGEIVFLVGPNGSGKSTILKLLSGLYVPSAGTLAVDEVPVSSRNRATYRQMISAVFSDFHLFTKLYGHTQASPEVVLPLLARLGLDQKTSFAEGGFTRRDLSTGQRKRLALVVALLEDRPLYVFDEWAADQDPEFRRYFYLELLPTLKQRGKAVLAVTHDDRYFSCADRVVRMQAGRVLGGQEPNHAQAVGADPSAQRG